MNYYNKNIAKKITKAGQDYLRVLMASFENGEIKLLLNEKSSPKNEEDNTSGNLLDK